jgi:hypothetical protein
VGGPGKPGGPEQGRQTPWIASGGDVDPVSGLPEWVDLGPAAYGGVTWSALIEVWPLIEADLATEYGYEGDLRDRSARWLRVRIDGLLSADTRTYRAFAPKDTNQGTST